MGESPLHTSQITVRFYDTDQSGTVFFANHIKWFDAVGIWEYLKARDIEWSELVEAEADIAVVRQHCDYRTPLLLDDVVDLTVDAVDVGNSSLTFRGRIVKADSGELVASCEVVYVFVHAVDRHAIPIPSQVRTRVAPSG